MDASGHYILVIYWRYNLYLWLNILKRMNNETNLIHLIRTICDLYKIFSRFNLIKQYKFTAGLRFIPELTTLFIKVIRYKIKLRAILINSINIKLFKSDVIFNIVIYIKRFTVTYPKLPIVQSSSIGNIFQIVITHFIGTKRLPV